MAKLEKTLVGDFDSLLQKIEKGVLGGSISATLEDAADYRGADSRCSVRVFERYSWSGGNRVSMNVTLYQSDKIIQLCAITSGGSQATFFKVNTLGEEAFLETLEKILH